MDIPRREIARTLVLLLNTQQDLQDPRLHLIMVERLDWLIDAEKRAVKQMARFKDQPSTRANYVASRETLTDLQDTLSAVKDSHYEEALVLLWEIADPDNKMRGAIAEAEAQVLRRAARAAAAATPLKRRARR